jgi:hypothetical protein
MAELFCSSTTEYGINYIINSCIIHHLAGLMPLIKMNTNTKQTVKEAHKKTPANVFDECNEAFINSCAASAQNVDWWLDFFPFWKNVVVAVIHVDDTQKNPYRKNPATVKFSNNLTAAVKYLSAAVKFFENFICG